VSDEGEIYYIRFIASWVLAGELPPVDLEGLAFGNERATAVRNPGTGRSRNLVDQVEQST
jgi:hypothetical protein